MIYFSVIMMVGVKVVGAFSEDVKEGFELILWHVLSSSRPFTEGVVIRFDTYTVYESGEEKEFAQIYYCHFGSWDAVDEVDADDDFFNFLKVLEASGENYYVVVNGWELEFSPDDGEIQVRLVSAFPSSLLDRERQNFEWFIEEAAKINDEMFKRLKDCNEEDCSDVEIDWYLAYEDLSWRFTEWMNSLNGRLNGLYLDGKYSISYDAAQWLVVISGDRDGLEVLDDLLEVWGIERYYETSGDEWASLSVRLV